MLPFEEQYLTDVLSSQSGGLLVLSSGLLRLQTLIPSLLSHHPSLLLLASSPSPLLRSLVSADIPGDLPAHHRAALYKDLKPHLVTPRVLVADLLTGRCRAEDVEGVVVVGAERVSETSTEAFVVRLLRMGNKGVVVYAVTDRPQAMVSGFAKAERVMKALLIRKLHLWPRFHVQVSADLEKDPPEVVDVRVPMTAAMKAVQNAVLEAMDACLKEVRRTNKVDVEDLTVESGLFKSFDEIVRRQLDPIWHTIGKKTRQLVADLRTLRKLADYLVRYDAVTFLIYLDTLRASEGAQSIWIFANSSHKIFEFAKRRVYHVFLPDGSKSSHNGVASRGKKRKEKEDKRSTNNSGTGETNAVAGVTLEEVLEEAPKWRVLRELLKEIQEERKNSNFPTETECIADCDADSNVILIACKDERSCMQLNDCLVKGPQQVMREEWEKYLVGKAELLDLNKRKKHKKQQTKGFGVLDGEVPASIMGNARGTSINKLENDALLAVASGIQAQTMEEIVGRTDTESSNRKVAPRKGKGKLKKDAGNVPGNRSSTKNVPIDESKASTSGNDSTISDPDAIVAGELHRDVQLPFLQKHSLQNSGSDSYSFKSLPGVQFYAIESNQNILDVLKPSVIVVYHADVTFIRDIEVYKAENPSKKLKVYFLFYEDSTEVQKFEASIRRENAAFESLIRQKSMMTIPVDQDGRVLGYASLAEAQSVLTDNSSTRKAGGRKVAVKEMQVIVDMREFNSSLPNVLHQKGMRIIPVTLEVGDYILSPSICVERKSISDLFQSFASGRLYNQVEMMARYYQIPVLLIEFSQDKSFSFQSANDIGDDVSPRSIVSKLSLLVLHFPRLRLVWSRSVHATAEIFASLKTNQDEPDETKAVRVGVPSDDGVVADDVRAENFNTTAVEFLRRLPGVTDSNYRSLMDGCNSLAELALLPVEKLAELMGGQKAARTLRDFLDAKCPTML